MTDGEDTASKNSVENATIAVHNAKIIMDSFAVGCDCEGLKTVTKATGGKCYLTRNLEESLKLFEQETVLSVRARVGETQETRLTIEQLMARARAKPFDLVGNVHAFKIPESKPSLNARDMVKYM